MRQPLISVIVPIYKVEKYLDKCILSILHQTYNNLEVILVDDGSPDNCGSICDQYARVDSRIKVIHKSNGGLSEARNVAIDAMKGEYVAFVDSDDSITPDYIEVLYGLIEKFHAQMSVVDFAFDYENVTLHLEKRKYKEKCFSNQDAIEEMFYQGDFDDYAWCKLYQRSLFNDIRFPKGLLYEDTYVSYRIMALCDKIAYCNKQMYNYLIREDSIEGQPFSAAKLDSALKIFDSMENEHFDIVKPVEKAFKCRMLSFAAHLLIKTPKDYDMKYVLWNKITKYRWEVLTDFKARPKARVAALISYFGLDVMIRAFKLVDKRK